MTIISALGRLRKNDHEFEKKVDSTVNLGPAEEALS